MKIKPLFIIYFIITLTTYSQEFSVGIKGGLNVVTPGELLHLGTASGGGNNVDPSEDFLYKAGSKTPILLREKDYFDIGGNRIK